MTEEQAIDLAKSAKTVTSWEELTPMLVPGKSGIVEQPTPEQQEILKEAFKGVFKKPPMPTSEQLDFILIRQKDIILKLIDNKQLDRAKACLIVVKELWEACEYEYKYKELHQKIIEARV